MDDCILDAMKNPSTPVLKKICYFCEHAKRQNDNVVFSFLTEIEDKVNGLKLEDLKALPADRLKTYHNNLKEHIQRIEALIIIKQWK